MDPINYVNHFFHRFVSDSSSNYKKSTEHGLPGSEVLPEIRDFVAGSLGSPRLQAPLHNKAGFNLSALGAQLVGDSRSFTASPSAFGQLRSIGDGVWRSAQGLIYNSRDPVFQNRVLHVLDHLNPREDKRRQSIFAVSRQEVLSLIDEAWSKRSDVKPLKRRHRWEYTIPMGRIVGTRGEQSILMVVERGNVLITAYPVHFVERRGG